MSGATRRGLPKCEETVIKYENRRPVGMGPCNKPAVAKYYYRAVSNTPKYVCEIHDKEIIKMELQEDLERDEENAWKENNRRQGNF